MRRASPVTPVKGRLILVEGERTGHHHSIRDRAGVTFFNDGVEAFLDVQGSREAGMTHQEHSTVMIAPGNNEVVQQRTAVPGDEMQPQRVARAWD